MGNKAFRNGDIAHYPIGPKTCMQYLVVSRNLWIAYYRDIKPIDVWGRYHQFHHAAGCGSEIFQ